MSTRELKAKINFISKNMIDILEKEKDEEKKVRLFENFYSTLNLIQDIYNPLENKWKIKKII
ncbi:MAG: hypothetical protein QXH92_04900 [Candidatus Aenigmatarchaeota archaeon]